MIIKTVMNQCSYNETRVLTILITIEKERYLFQ